MELWNTLQAVPLPILIVALVILLAITAVVLFQYLKMKGLDGIRERVYQLILNAEHTFTGTEQGKQKLGWVVQQARGLLPIWLQLFVSEKTLMKIVDAWFLGVKDLLDDGKVNGSGDVNE